MPDLHTRIKDTRIRRGFSQSRLAELAGVSQPTVANWETGSHTPRQAALSRISEALNVEESWLLSGGAIAADHSAQAYLSRTIRHIPIYRWPDAGEPLFASPALDYMPYPTRAEAAFGLVGPQRSQSRKRVLIIDPTVHELSENHLYLWTDGDIIEADAPAKIPSEASLLGRVKSDIRIY